MVNGSWVKHDTYRRVNGEWVKQDEYLTVPIINYLTFSSAEAFTIGVNDAAKHWDGTLYYSTDTTTWSEWDGATAIASAEHSGEQRIYMRGVGNSVITGSSNSNYRWTMTGSNIRCDGNIENLLNHEAVSEGAHPEMGAYCYSSMFFESTALITSPELPATDLSEYCYYYMFSGTGLTTPPKLPATTLAVSCYQGMFYGCTGLTNAPKLPAKEMAEYCYNGMFSSTGLTTAPELPATTLAKQCYAGMFRNCTNLTNAPQLPASVLAQSCYRNMFNGCSNLTLAPSLPATTLAEDCYYWMFRECTRLATIPTLPATTLAKNCYRLMFMECTSIKLSATKTGDYQNEYRVPNNGTGTVSDEDDVYNMFGNTGGTFTGTPTINTTYYTSNAVV